MPEQPRGALVVCLSRGFGGAEVRVLALAAALHGRRTYAVATLDDSPLARRLAARGLNVLPVGRGRADPRLALRLALALRQRGLGLVDAHNPQSQFWAPVAAALAGVRVRVCTVHSVYARTAGPWWKAWLYVMVLRLSGAWRCRFVAISGEIADSLRAIGIPEDSITRSPNGIAADWASVDGDARPRAELGWQDATVVAMVGRLIPEKGHANMLRALARLRREHPAARCLVVGEGGERARLEALTASLGLGDAVHFAGFRCDIAEILADSDLVCLPSLTEGLPYVALEAASLGRPLVASAVGELPAYFEHGADARLVRPGDIDGLVAELDWCLRHPDAARRMGEAARAMALDRLSPERMLADTVAVYDS